MGKVINTPEQALEFLTEAYAVHRYVATMTVTAQRTLADLSDYERLMREMERAIAQAREAGDTDAANRWRHAESFTQALRDELRMWLHLKEMDMHGAWTAFVAADSSARQAAMNLPDFEPAEKQQEHMGLVERVVFPPQRFFSPSFIVPETGVECSICGVRGGECAHIPGNTYGGEVAFRKVHDIEAVREVSLVNEPASKHARALTFGEMDLLTLGPVKRSNNNKRKKRRRKR